MKVGAVRRSVRVTIAGLLLAVVFPTVAAAATKYLTVSGEVSGAEAQNLAVLLVANDGTSTRVPVNSTGKFTAKIPAADRKSTRLNSSHSQQSRMPSSA